MFKTRLDGYAMVGSILHVVAFGISHVIYNGIPNDHAVCFFATCYVFDHVVYFFKTTEKFNLGYDDVGKLFAKAV